MLRRSYFNMAQVLPATLFTAQGCPYCRKAKETLQSKQLSYKEYDADAFEKFWTPAAKATGQETVPLVFFGAQHIGGASEIKDLEAKGTLVATYKKYTEDATATLPPYLQIDGNSNL